MAGYGHNGKSEHGMKGEAVKPINANEADYERFEILGHDALFTCLRIDRKSLPEGLYAICTNLSKAQSFANEHLFCVFRHSNSR